MPRKEIIDRINKYVDPFRITKDKGFRLKDFDPSDTCGLKLDKTEATELLQRGTEWLAEEQDKLYAQDRWSATARLSGDGRRRQGRHDQARHVRRESPGMSGFSFKHPSAEDLDHDFLCRLDASPSRGRIGIFNRSYYEEVLVVRVHQEQHPQATKTATNVGKRIWDERLSKTSQISRTTSRGRERSFSNSS